MNPQHVMSRCLKLMQPFAVLTFMPNLSVEPGYSCIHQMCHTPGFQCLEIGEGKMLLFVLHVVAQPGVLEFLERHL